MSRRNLCAGQITFSQAIANMNLYMDYLKDLDTKLTATDWVLKNVDSCSLTEKQLDEAIRIALYDLYSLQSELNKIKTNVLSYQIKYEQLLKKSSEKSIELNSKIESINELWDEKRNLISGKIERCNKVMWGALSV